MQSSAEHFAEARAAWCKLKDAWAAADVDTRFDLVAHFVGRALMAAAIVGAFGWWGALFLFGTLLWRVFR